MGPSPFLTSQNGTQEKADPQTLDTEQPPEMKTRAPCAGVFVHSESQCSFAPQGSQKRYSSRLAYIGERRAQVAWGQNMLHASVPSVQQSPLAWFELVCIGPARGHVRLKAS